MSDEFYNKSLFDSVEKNFSYLEETVLLNNQNLEQVIKPGLLKIMNLIKTDSKDIYIHTNENNVDYFIIPSKKAIYDGSNNEISSNYKYFIDFNVNNVDIAENILNLILITDSNLRVFSNKVFESISTVHKGINLFPELIKNYFIPSVNELLMDCKTKLSPDEKLFLIYGEADEVEYEFYLVNKKKKDIMQKNINNNTLEFFNMDSLNVIIHNYDLSRMLMNNLNNKLISKGV